MAVAGFRFPTDIRFGSQAILLLPELLKQGKSIRPLIVTDQGLAKLPIMSEIQNLLHSNGFETAVFSEASGNPIHSHVDAGVKAYRQHQADALVMLGGGCAIDVAKAIALMVNHPGDLFDYEDDMPGARPIDQAIPLAIAIPTTAGTGSEVGGSSVISDDKTHEKKIIWSPRLIPKHVIADPDLTTGLPPFLTAATGIDALTHNVEAFLAKNFHPICDGIALEGIRLVFEHLETAYREPTNINARAGMLLASMMGAIAFQKGLGVTHSCAHSLSTCHDMHHGLANAMMMTPCLRWNAEVVPERFVRMAKIINLSGKNDAELIELWFNRLEQLKAQIKIPARLSELGVELSDRLIDVAVRDACHGNNPRPCRPEDFKALFQQAI